MGTACCQTLNNPSSDDSFSKNEPSIISTKTQTNDNEDDNADDDDMFDQLPQELIAYILSYFTETHRIRMKTVCKTFYITIKSLRCKSLHINWSNNANTLDSLKCNATLSLSTVNNGYTDYDIAYKFESLYNNQIYIYTDNWQKCKSFSAKVSNNILYIASTASDTRIYIDEKIIIPSYQISKYANNRNKELGIFIKTYMTRNNLENTQRSIGFAIGDYKFDWKDSKVTPIANYLTPFEIFITLQSVIYVKVSGTKNTKLMYNKNNVQLFDKDMDDMIFKRKTFGLRIIEHRMRYGDNIDDICMFGPINIDLAVRDNETNHINIIS